MKIATILFIAATLVSSLSYADDYKPNDAKCIEYFKTTCAKINLKEYEDCTMNPFKRDSQNRIIGPNITTRIEKKDDFMQKNVVSAGCQHASDVTTYYFNKDINFDSINCSEILKIWNSISITDEYKIPDIKKIPEKFEETKFCSAMKDLDGYDFWVEISLKKSDVAGYKFAIEMMNGNF
jgi:hypothetical protein